MYSQGLISIAQQINACLSWKADLLPWKSRSFSGGGVASHVKHLPLNRGSSGVGIRAAWRNFCDGKLSALHARASQCSLEGSDLNSTHTPVASAWTAMPVLNGEKEVKKKRKKERSTASVIMSSSMKISAPCPVAVRAVIRHRTGEGDREWDAEILLCHSINRWYILTLNPAAKASFLISTRI